MAQEFLESIYKHSLLITDFEDSVTLLHQGSKIDAQHLYNSAATSVEKLLEELAPINNELAMSILTDAKAISDNWEDSSFAAGLITSRLIPSLYRFMSYFTDIDVSENEFRIKSSDSGFLTITDTQCKITYHDSHNPMREASELADSFYVPTNKEVHIFGCDMGYLPYMLYKKSEGSIKLVIYENDPRIVYYAREFGVLDWIPEECIELKQIPDLKLLAKEYLDFINTYDTEICSRLISTHISPWKSEQYLNAGIDIIKKQAEIDIFNKSIYQTCVINITKNYSKKHISFDEIKSKYSRDECIIVAAGPSLDESINFIKESIESRTIIAVNTVIKRMHSESITPDIVVAADARPQLLDHIYGYEEFTKDIYLIADETTCWKYIEAYRGNICLVPTPNGMGIPVSNPNNLDLWEIYGTVTALAVESAIRLGAKRIYLAGLDLAYPGGINYAIGVSHERLETQKGDFLVKAVDGKTVETSPVFDLFRQAIEVQIANNPDVDFINLSKHGALIKGARKP